MPSVVLLHNFLVFRVFASKMHNLHSQQLDFLININISIKFITVDGGSQKIIGP